MKKMLYGLLSTLTLTTGLITTAHATLIDNGNGTVTDTSTSLMWLKDANANGLMNWNDAMAWANNLTVGGYTDWRLPTMVDSNNDGCTGSNNGTDCGFNVDTATSELAHMWYITLNNIAFFDTSGNSPQAGFGLTSTSADGVTIDNLQAMTYWLGTEYVPNTNDAWLFVTNDGWQGAVSKPSELYAWAVRSSNVGASTGVPEPGVLVLLSLGLVGMAAARRRC